MPTCVTLSGRFSRRTSAPGRGYATGIAFERSTSYVINNFGATTNLTNIVGYLDSVEGVRVKKQTLGGYLDLLENAKLAYRCPPL